MSTSRQGKPATLTLFVVKGVLSKVGISVLMSMMVGIMEALVRMYFFPSSSTRMFVPFSSVSWNEQRPSRDTDVRLSFHNDFDKLLASALFLLGSQQHWWQHSASLRW